jgi:hypothetical protein
MLQVLPDGKLLVVDGLLPPECCCDCTGKEPTAEFSFTQTDDDPCTFDFFDESTAHMDCGEIVGWLWEYWDGDEWIEFSTDQNPTGAELPGAGPWDVRLTVTDECGCRDVVVMEVECEPLHLCANCELPESVSITLPTIEARTSGGCANVCTLCAGLSGYGFDIPYSPTGFGSGSCVYDGDTLTTIDGCTFGTGVCLNTGLQDWRLSSSAELTYNVGTGKWKWFVSVEMFTTGTTPAGNSNFNFELDNLDECRGTFSLPYLSANYGSTPFCQWDSGDLILTV